MNAPGRRKAGHRSSKATHRDHPNSKRDTTPHSGSLNSRCVLLCKAAVVQAGVVQAAAALAAIRQQSDRVY